MRLSGVRLKLIPLFSTFTLLLNLSAIYAQELEPRAYSNIPVGLNFAIAGYTYMAGGVLFDPTVPLENANIKINGSIFAYARSIKIGTLSGKFDMIFPYAWVSGTADYQGQPVSRVVSGFADPRVRLSVNFVGAPALSLSGFKDYKQNLIVGTSLQVYLPVGQYDPDKLVNIGTNRFIFKPEIGISKKAGPWFLELASGIAFYTVNHDFYQGKTRSQAPIYSVQGHVIYSLQNGIWGAIDGNYYWGGRTTLDGVKGNDLQENSRFGFTCGLPINRRNSLKFNYSTGVSTRTGSDFDSFSAAWQYRWSKDFSKSKKP